MLTSPCAALDLMKASYMFPGKPPFKRLIYPMPESWGLGVHLTLDLEGRARFGPDVEWIDKVEYNTSSELCDKFYPVIRQYWPGLPDGSLKPSYSGIRPKVCVRAHVCIFAGPRVFETQPVH